MSKANGDASKILPRQGVSYKLRPEADTSALHAEHSVHPHSHPLLDGKPKACSGNYWCVTCQAWFNATECHA